MHCGVGGTAGWQVTVYCGVGALRGGRSLCTTGWDVTVHSRVGGIAGWQGITVHYGVGDTAEELGAASDTRRRHFSHG